MTLQLLDVGFEPAGMTEGDQYKWLQNVQTLVNQLQAKQILDTALINQMRILELYYPIGNPGFAISSNFDVKNANAISYVNNGTLKTLSANTNFDTGTAATIATTKWNAALLSVSSAGSAVLTWANAAGAASYASEAAAIAALVAAAATDTVLGYVTVQAAGGTWTPGTDALTTGTGGTPATTTNYYNHINPNSLLLGAASVAIAELNTLKLTKG